MFYDLIKKFLYLLFKIILRLKVDGQENIPKTGALVIASNHISLLDPPVLGVCSTRKVHFMAKQELFVPILGTIYRLLGAFPVRRGVADRTAIRHGIEILRQEECLAIFPEGTRSKTGELGKAEPGALLMAAKTNAVIVPACIDGADIKRCGRLWPKVSVRFGKPLYFPEGPLNKYLLRIHGDTLMERIGELQEELRHEN